MATIYIIIVGFLLLLAVFDLFVGVSNDAVNFLNSGVGARIARWRTLLIMASLGVVVGAFMSSGMMDVARHGIMLPSNFSFADVIVVFLAVMATDVIVLDRFNSLGLPTSTTVSLVFELFGAASFMAAVKLAQNEGVAYADLINTDKCLSVIVAIFVSVGIAFVCGAIVQWLARLVFTFQSSKVGYVPIAIFGGLAFTILSYFIFLKGLGKSPMISQEVRTWVAENIKLLLFGFFVVSTVLSLILMALKVSVFKIIILLGTFALAMAFAGNDLVNFIGVPLAGLDSFQDWFSAGCPDPDKFMMTSLMESAKSSTPYLLGAGLIMILALVFSRKALAVVKTSVDLSRQDSSDEMFGSSRPARSIVRNTEAFFAGVERLMPRGLKVAIGRRFDNRVTDMPDGAAFDAVRAAVNLVLSSVLIVIGTSYKLPLSTTYVTFMVAMGTSLADKAWGRETAVFRVSGVLTVIGGWFLTAAIAFITAAAICAVMYYCGFVAMFAFMVLVVFVVVKSNFLGKKSSTPDADRALVEPVDLTPENFNTRVAVNDSASIAQSKARFNDIVDAFLGRRVRALRQVGSRLDFDQRAVHRYRRVEIFEYGKIVNTADPQVGSSLNESGLWLQLGLDCRSQYLKTLRQMLSPVLEHVDNGFNPLPKEAEKEFAPIRRSVNELFEKASWMVKTLDFEDYEALRLRAIELRKILKATRHAHMDRLQSGVNSKDFKVIMVYINLLRETQNLVNNLRHHIQAVKCFNSPQTVSEEEIETSRNGEY
ncbi:MAG: inorganic phosphate transporter family protein [Bacteroidales bacterium]|nr:inorganic phosphate transporter family protein [Bacteroidales bacterium]